MPLSTRRHLSKDEVASFRRDGALCVRGLYSAEWLAMLREALDDIAKKPSRLFGPRKDQKSVTDAFTWLTDDRIRDFVLTGPTAHIMKDALRSETVGFFYDQVFVRDILSPIPSPWHRDSVFWPLRGRQIGSMWMSVDPITPESSALELVAGSHAWVDDDVPDVEARRDELDILSFALEPGDALLFDARTLHGARGNASATTKRRAIATRWFGDDVIYWRKSRQMPVPWRHGLKNGDRLSGPLFPRVSPTVDEAAVAARMKGPIEPDPKLIDAAARLLATAKP